MCYKVENYRNVQNKNRKYNTFKKKTSHSFLSLLCIYNPAPIFLVNLLEWAIMPWFLKNVLSQKLCAFLIKNNWKPRGERCCLTSRFFFLVYRLLNMFHWQEIFHMCIGLLLLLKGFCTKSYLIHSSYISL